MSQAEIDQAMMAHALAMGRRGLGRVWPWPSVGCVIARGSRVVGRGTSDRATMRHAEVVALDQAGPAAKGATAYVTLEPCSHHGNTPPCADALIKAGVARVVAALKDPNPAVDGQGIERLRQAGIQVETGLYRDEAARDQAGFLLSVTQGRPFVTLKLAASLDGRIATASGESRWITGPQARARVHALRASHDAVLVGGGTARADDPELTVRGMGRVAQPVRIVASRFLDLPADAKLVTSAAQSPVWYLHGPGAKAGALADTAVKLIEVEAGPDRNLSPGSMMKTMSEQGLTSVFCEGGGMLAASLLGAGLVDRLVVFHAGLGLGAEAVPSLGTLGLSTLAEAKRFDLVSHRQVGADLETTWAPRP